MYILSSEDLRVVFKSDKKNLDAVMIKLIDSLPQTLKVFLSNDL